jgi:hypothetical protein
MRNPPGTFGWLLWLSNHGEHVRGGGSRAQIVEGIPIRVHQLGYGSSNTPCNTGPVILDWRCEGTNDMSICMT